MYHLLIFIQRSTETTEKEPINPEVLKPNRTNHQHAATPNPNHHRDKKKHSATNPTPLKPQLLQLPPDPHHPHSPQMHIHLKNTPLPHPIQIPHNRPPSPQHQLAQNRSIPLQTPELPFQHPPINALLVRLQRLRPESQILEPESESHKSIFESLVRDPVGLCVSREGCGEAEGGFEVDYEGAEGGVVWDQGAFLA